MQEHQVQAPTGERFVQMLQNFANNDDLIEATNSKNLSYKLGHNKYSHMSLEEFREHMKLGLGYPKAAPSSIVHSAPADVSSMATSVDWVSKGSVTGVKDQGSCGSCWSFSTTGALEGAHHIKTGSLVSFSEQLFVDCDNNGDHGCMGGLMDNAFEWASGNGYLCTEDSYPYVSGTTKKAGTCQKTCTKNTAGVPRSYTDVQKNSESALMDALNKQPVSVAIEADEASFQLYKSGVLTASCGTNLDHGVLAVGYGTWTDGTPYWKVKNSWGTSWGMDGYILLERGVSQRGGQCGILMGPPSYPNL